MHINLSLIAGIMKYIKGGEMNCIKNTWPALVLFVLILTWSSQGLCTLFYWDPNNGGNGHYYEWVSYSGNWSDLLATALDTGFTSEDSSLTGGYLATITSAEENAFIISKFASNSLAFLGARDSNYTNSKVTQASAIWRWENGPEAGDWFYNEGNNTSVYANWAPGQPSDLNIHYLAIYLNDNSTNYGKWYDTNNGGYSGGPISVDGYIAEYSTPVPEPASILLFGIGLLCLAGIDRKKQS